MKKFFKKIDWMIVLFIVAELCNLGGIVIGFVDHNPYAATWAIASATWCATAFAWYMSWKTK